MDSFFRQALILTLMLCLGTYVILLGFLKRINQWYYVDRLGKKKHSLPPGDMGWPLLGNLLSFLKAFTFHDRETFINNMVKKHGRTGIYKSYLFGSPSIIVCSPEGCKKVLTDERFAPSQSPSLKMLINNKLNDASGSEHRRLRNLLAYPINSHEALALYMGYITDIISSALEDWSCMNTPIEFMKEMEKITFKAFIHVFMGSIDESVRKSMEKYNYDFVKGIIYTNFGVPGFPFHKALKARRMLEKIFLQILKDKRSKMDHKSEDRNENKVMMDLLLEVEDENGEKFSDNDICSLLLLLLVAGHHSIAMTASWTVIYLHNHPQVLQKTREEQEEIVKRRPSTQKGLSVQDISQMDYLAKVIDETLRKVAPFTLIRVAMEDVNVNGYLIPKGWTVFVWLNAIHMDPEIYMNPKEFNPSRWNNKKPKLGSFLAFGAGIRYCIGAAFAKFQISIFLHHFLLNYKLEQINPEGPISNLPTPKPKDNCLGRVIKL